MSSGLLDRMNEMGTATTREPSGWELAAESITVKIRWFGVAVGYLLVNFLDRPAGDDRAVMNAILDPGGDVRAGRYAVEPAGPGLSEPLAADHLADGSGLHRPVVLTSTRASNSPFRFYYFLSLLVCAIRYSPAVTLATLALHSISYGELFFSRGTGDQGSGDVVRDAGFDGLGDVGLHVAGRAAQGGRTAA